MYGTRIFRKGLKPSDYEIGKTLPARSSDAK